MKNGGKTKATGVVPIAETAFDGVEASCGAICMHKISDDEARIL